MRVTLSSYALVGIEAVPVDVVVDRDGAKVIEPESPRSLHSVRLDRIVSERPIPEHAVNARTSPLRNLAPERTIARKFYPASPFSLLYPSLQINKRNHHTIMLAVYRL
jgi:hypothetical protein